MIFHLGMGAETVAEPDAIYNLFGFKNYEPAGIAQAVKRLVTGWRVHGSNPCGGEIFRTRPYQPWDPPSLLYNGYRGKRQGRGFDHPPHLAPRLKKEYNYSSTPPLDVRGLF
jgi:hypothetical protein